MRVLLNEDPATPIVDQQDHCWAHKCQFPLWIDIDKHDLNSLRGIFCCDGSESTSRWAIAGARVTATIVSTTWIKAMSLSVVTTVPDGMIIAPCTASATSSFIASVFTVVFSRSVIELATIPMVFILRYVATFLVASAFWRVVVIVGTCGRFILFVLETSLNDVIRLCVTDIDLIGACIINLVGASGSALAICIIVFNTLGYRGGWIIVGWTYYILPTLIGRISRVRALLTMLLQTPASPTVFSPTTTTAPTSGHRKLTKVVTGWLRFAVRRRDKSRAVARCEQYGEGFEARQFSLRGRSTALVQLA